MKLIVSHGRPETQDYFSSIEHMDYITLGYNFRMSNIVAALGISQLEKADTIIEMRRKNANYMTEELKKVGEVTVPSAPRDYHHVYQMYTIRVNANSRDELMRYLADKGIMTKTYFSPVHLTHFYRNELKYECRLPATEEISNQVLTSPMSPTLTKEETDYMTREIRDFFARPTTS